MANSLLFSLLMKMDAGQAKAELATVSAAMKKTGSDGAALATALPKVTQNTVALGRANQQAAGSVGNLVAQFNDIGMMIAAGQNPLQLAIQQGTQISQVIGPMGAAGAMKALGGAFLSFLNPINFVTLAVIAGGAAFAQWAMSGGEAAASFEDQLDALVQAIKSYDEAMDMAAMSSDQLFAKLGASSPIMQVVLADLAAIEKLKAHEKLRETAAALGDVITMWGDRSAASNMQDFLGVGNMTTKSRELGATFLANLTTLQLTEDPAQRLAAALNLRDMLAENVGSLGQMNAEQRAFSEGLSRIILQSQILAGVNNESAEAAKKRLEDQKSASDILADLQAEAEMNATIALYGEQSAEATALRAAQEREAFVEMVKSLDVTDQMRLAMVVAYDNAQALAGVDFATGIGLGADEALRMGGNLAAAANAWLAARSLANQPERLAMTKYGSRGTVSNRPIEDGQGEVIRIKSSTRGAGGGGAAKEADSVAKLIEKLQDELDITRELDPVQQEMARYRDQLAKATDGEREKVEALIATRIREKAAMESLSYVGEQSGNALIDGLMGAADAGERLIDTLMRAALQALILGKGPLANILGGGGGLMGGLFSGLGGGAQGGLFDLFGGGALIGGLADGGGVGDGMIYGAGGPRDDLVPFWGSAGEFVVNARATHRHRALLEQINSGQLDSAPAFANGGAIGGSAGVAGGGGLGGGTVFNAYFDLSGAQGDDAVQAAAKRGMDAALREFARSELPSQVRRISADPSVTRF